MTVVGVLLLTLTACTAPMTRGALEEPMALGRGWNAADARVIAEALIKEALHRPWAQRFAKFMGRVPVVMVGTVLDQTPEHLDIPSFITDLQRALMHSGHVQSVTDTGQLAGQGPGADFVLQGSINTLVEEHDSARAVFYQVDLEIVDLSSDVKVWMGQKKITKSGERSKTAS